MRSGSSAAATGRASTSTSSAPPRAPIGCPPSGGPASSRGWWSPGCNGQRARGAVDATIAEARALLEHAAAADDPTLEAVALVNLGVGELWTAEPAHAVPVLQEALAAARRADREVLELTVLGALAAAQLTSGRMTRALDAAQRAVDLGNRRGWGELAPMALAYGTLAAAAHLRDEPEEAAQWRRRAHHAAASSGDPLAQAALALLDHLAAAADGEPDAALAALRGAQHALSRAGAGAGSWRRPPWPPRSSTTLVAADDLAAADALLGSLAPPVRANGGVAAAAAVLRLAQGRTDEALAAIDAADAADVTAAITAMVRARVLERRGEVPAALAAVERALELVEPERPSPARARPRPGRAAPARARAAGDGPPSARRTSCSSASQGRPAGAGGDAGRPTHRPRARDPALPADAAARSRTSPRSSTSPPNTVRTHLKSIYRKLDVGQRRDAVERPAGCG